MTHILIAEDESRIADFIERGLREAGYLTTIADTGETALLLARTDAFDLIILDIGLPRLDGFSVLTRLREEGHSVPVVVLTARDSVTDRVTGLEGGANDYMVKPFEFAELLARVRLRLKETPAPGTETLDAAGLSLDLRNRRVTGEGVAADLTSREFAVLEAFMENRGQVLTRAQIIDHVWGYGASASSNVVDVFVRTLRGKIGEERIETVRGLGYRLVDLSD